MPLQTTEEDKEETEEATASLAAKEISKEKKESALRKNENGTDGSPRW